MFQLYFQCRLISVTKTPAQTWLLTKIATLRWYAKQKVGNRTWRLQIFLNNLSLFGANKCWVTNNFPFIFLSLFFFRFLSSFVLYFLFFTNVLLLLFHVIHFRSVAVCRVWTVGLLLAYLLAREKVRQNQTLRGNVKDQQPTIQQVSFSDCPRILWHRINRINK